MSEPKLSDSQKAAGVIYYNRVTFPVTPKIRHEFTGYKFASFSRDIQDTAIDPRGAVAAILRHERRANRQAIASRLFYDTPTHGILLRAELLTLPSQQKTIVNIPLSIRAQGYSSADLLIGICQFLVWQCGQVERDRRLQLDGFVEIPEVEILRSSQILVTMFYLSAILAKYCNQIGADKTDNKEGGNERRAKP